MAARARLLAVLALLACACGGHEPGPAAAPIPAAAPAQDPPRPAARPTRRGDQVTGRRGDRHARAAAGRRPWVKQATGTVTRASERLVVIRPRGGPDLRLRVAPGTRVTVDGRPARAAALREGGEVRAAYRTAEGGRATALSIEADRRADPR